MYNRNFATASSLNSYRHIRRRPNLSGIASVRAYPKINTFETVTEGYTRPFPTYLTRPE